MPGAVGGTGHALGTFAQACLVQKVADKADVESFRGLTVDGREDSVLRLRGFGDEPDAFEVVADALGSMMSRQRRFFISAGRMPVLQATKIML